MKFWVFKILHAFYYENLKFQHEIRERERRVERTYIGFSAI
jgi:hypothetical protein